MAKKSKNNGGSSNGKKNNNVSSSNGGSTNSGWQNALITLAILFVVYELLCHPLIIKEYMLRPLVWVIGGILGGVNDFLVGFLTSRG